MKALKLKDAFFEATVPIAEGVIVGGALALCGAPILSATLVGAGVVGAFGAVWVAAQKVKI